MGSVLMRLVECSVLLANCLWLWSTACGCLFIGRGELGRRGFLDLTFADAVAIARGYSSN